MEHESYIWPINSYLQKSTIELNFLNTKYKGYYIAPSKGEGKKPLILIIHNYQGLKFFEIDVAEYIARLGYVGLAIDLYGDNVPEDERLWPEDSTKVDAFNKKCFKGLVSLDHDHKKFRSLLKSWLNVGLELPCVDNNYSPAAIGYCFGGMAVLECIRGGLNISGGVTFHGLLQTGEDPNPEKYLENIPKIQYAKNNYNSRAIIFIENGSEDQLVSKDNKNRFFLEMDNAGVDWNFHEHSRTPHGFALPPTLGPPGCLNETADRRSTMNMLNLFREIFPNVKQNSVKNNAAGTTIPI